MSNRAVTLSVLIAHHQDMRFLEIVCLCGIIKNGSVIVGATLAQVPATRLRDNHNDGFVVRGRRAASAKGTGVAEEHGHHSIPEVAHCFSQGI